MRQQDRVVEGLQCYFCCESGLGMFHQVNCGEGLKRRHIGNGMTLGLRYYFQSGYIGLAKKFT